jgi:hypothetical protein
MVMVFRSGQMGQNMSKILLNFIKIYNSNFL